MPRRRPFSTLRPGATVDLRATTSVEQVGERKDILLSGYSPSWAGGGSYFGGYSMVTGVPGRSWSMQRAVKEGMSRDVYLYRAVKTIAMDQSRLRFGIREGDLLSPDWQFGPELTDDPLLPLLNVRANPVELAYQLRERASMIWMLSPRGGFIEAEMTKGKRITALKLLPTMRTHVVPDSSGNIKNFRVDKPYGMGPPRTLDPDQVLWFREPHPDDPFVGLTALEAAGLDIEVDYFARLFNRQFLANDGRPGGIVAVTGPDGPKGQAADEEELERVERRLGGGPVDAGRFVVIDGTVQFIDTSGTPRDAQWQQARQMSKLNELGALGVPESVALMNATNSTFANSGQEWTNYWVHTQAPHSDAFALLFIDRVSGVPFLDYSKVEALQGPVRDRRAEMRDETLQGLRTPKAYALATGQKVGNDPDDDMPDVPATRSLWLTAAGKVPVAPNEEDQAEVDKLTPVGGGQAPPGGPDGAPPGGDQGGGDPFADLPAEYGGGPPNGNGNGTAAYDSNLKAIVAARVASRRRAGIKALTTAAKRGMREPDDEEDHRAARCEADLRRALTKTVNGLVADTLRSLATVRVRAGTRVGSAGGTKQLDTGQLVDQQAWEDRVAAATAPYLAAAAAAQQQTTQAQVEADAGRTLAEVAVGTAAGGVAGAAAVAVPGLAAAQAARLSADLLGELPHVVGFLAGSARGRAEDLVAAIAEAENEETARVAGGGAPAGTAAINRAVREWAAGLRGWIDRVAPASARQAVEAGKHAVLGRLGNRVERWWLSRRDDKVRPTHKATDGQVQSAGSPFVVGDALLRYPRDPLGPPGEVINCRCRTRWRLRREQKRLELGPFDVVAAVLEQKKVHHVRTPAGSRYYHLPVGSPIEARTAAAAAARVAAAARAEGRVDHVAEIVASREPWHAPVKPASGLIPEGESINALAMNETGVSDEMLDLFLGGLNGSAARRDRGGNPRLVADAERVEAKKEIARMLADRLAAAHVPDKVLLSHAGEMFGAYEGSNGDSLRSMLLDPQVLWQRDAVTDYWQPYDSFLGDADHDRRLREAVRDHDLEALAGFGFGENPYTGELIVALGGEDMLRQGREQAVRELVKTWATTSNDSSPRALAMQRAVAEEFGLDEATWTDGSSVEDDLQRAYYKWGQLYRTFARAQYDATQERLKGAGLDSVRLYRGVHLWTEQGVPEWARDSAGRELAVPLRPASAFSADAQTAIDFASARAAEQQVVLVADVPRERILAYPRTGVGCLGEWEFVVLAGPGKVAVYGDGDLVNAAQREAADAAREADADASEHESTLRFGSVALIASRADLEAAIAYAVQAADNDAVRKRREALTRRARALGHADLVPADWPEVKLLPANPSAWPDTRNEDWIKTLAWDVRDGADRLVTTLPQLAAVLGLSETEAAAWVRTMPAGEAAPDAIRSAKPDPESKARTRHVRTPGGARYFDEPIGAPIVLDPRRRRPRPVGGLADAYESMTHLFDDDVARAGRRASAAAEAAGGRDHVAEIVGRVDAAPAGDTSRAREDLARAGKTVDDLVRGGMTPEAAKKEYGRLLNNLRDTYRRQRVKNAGKVPDPTPPPVPTPRPVPNRPATPVDVVQRRVADALKVIGTGKEQRVASVRRRYTSDPEHRRLSKLVAAARERQARWEKALADGVDPNNGLPITSDADRIHTTPDDPVGQWVVGWESVRDQIASEQATGDRLAGKLREWEEYVSDRYDDKGWTEVPDVAADGGPGAQAHKRMLAVLEAGHSLRRQVELEWMARRDARGGYDVGLAGEQESSADWRDAALAVLSRVRDIGARPEDGLGHEFTVQTVDTVDHVPAGKVQVGQTVLVDGRAAGVEGIEFAAGGVLVLHLDDESQHRFFPQEHVLVRHPAPSPADRELMEKALADAEGFYPAEWVEASQSLGGIEVGTSERGNFTPPNRMFLSRRPRVGIESDSGYSAVATHELGHRMEHALPLVKELEWAYYWMRTSEGPTGHRRRDGKNALVRRPGYNDDEKFRLDDFKDGYAGKEYRNGPDAPWELFTTAAESLFNGTHYADPDQEAFALGVLATVGHDGQFPAVPAPADPAAPAVPDDLAAARAAVDAAKAAWSAPWAGVPRERDGGPAAESLRRQDALLAAGGELDRAITDRLLAAGVPDPEEYEGIVQDTSDEANAAQSRADAAIAAAIRARVASPDWRPQNLPPHYGYGRSTYDKIVELSEDNDARDRLSAWQELANLRMWAREHDADFERHRAEYERRLIDWRGAVKDADAAKAAWAKAWRDAAIDALGKIRPVGPEGESRLSVFGGRTGLDEHAVDAIHAASAWYPRDWIDHARQRGSGSFATPRDLTVRFDQKHHDLFGYFNSEDTAIVLSDNPRFLEETAIHELGHFMEVTVPRLLEAEWVFHWHRVAPGEPGERPPLPEADSADGVNVYGFPVHSDHYPEPYTGREYAAGVSPVPSPSQPRELLTTIVQDLFGLSRLKSEGRSGRVSADDEMRRWALGVLATL